MRIFRHTPADEKKHLWIAKLADCPDAYRDDAGRLCIPAESECFARTRAEHGPKMALPPIKPPGFGPGTELKKLLAELGIEPNNTCDCDQMSRLMDISGVEGCRKHRADIVDFLKTGSARFCRKHRTAMYVRGAIKAGKTLSLKTIAASILDADPFGALVDEAIRRAETVL